MAVDDSASVRQMVSFTLSEAGYNVIEACNGRDAIQKLNSNAPNLIVTDLNMPEMNGIDLIRNVRTNPRYKFVPIILLTTESNDDKKKEGKSAGATGWIVKPFKPEQLLSVIKKVIG